MLQNLTSLSNELDWSFFFSHHAPHLISHSPAEIVCSSFSIIHSVPVILPRLGVDGTHVRLSGKHKSLQQRAREILQLFLLQRRASQKFCIGADHAKRLKTINWPVFCFPLLQPRCSPRRVERAANTKQSVTGRRSALRRAEHVITYVSNGLGKQQQGSEAVLVASRGRFLDHLRRLQSVWGEGVNDKLRTDP